MPNASVKSTENSEEHAKAMNECTEKKFRRVGIFGVRFHCLTVTQLLSFIVDRSTADRQAIIGNVNVRALNLAYELGWFQTFLNHCDLVFCDGFGVLLGARLLGDRLPRQYRMTAPDFIDDLATACAQAQKSLFLLAGNHGVAERAAEKMRQQHPGLTVHAHHGHFAKHGPENKAVVDVINTAQPDILLVGFGMPLQEEWILANREALAAKVIMPLGAFLDFYTGRVPRGPRCLTGNGAEWLTRLCTEPLRLWKRYLLGNPLFLYRILKERRHGR